MNNSFLGRLKSVFNIFRDRNPKEEFKKEEGVSSNRPLYRPTFNYGNERSIVGAVYNRCAIDVSVLKFRHVRIDENEAYLENVESGLNNCITLEANKDQTHRDFIRDTVISLFDEGVVAIVPTDTSVSIDSNNVFDVLTLRTGRIVQWFPNRVRVRLYNDNTGENEEITLDKSKVAIIENPLYSVMNERNSVGQRLIAKLNLLDVIDKQSGSGKLDIIMQFPFSVKSTARKDQANLRRKELEDQLNGSQYGIAWADATEKITQLNRPAENNLMAQIEYLTRMLYGQLGISEAILDGTAEESELVNYYNRVLEPVASAITDEFKRKFISKTARSQKQSIMHFHNLFSIVTPARLGDLADKLTRNEVASPNDMRAVIGWKPSKAKGADELRNRNLNKPDSEASSDQPLDVTSEFGKVNQSKGE